MRTYRSSRLLAVMVAMIAAVAAPALVGASAPGADVRLTNDAPGTGGYVSNYTMNTGVEYTDATLTECSRSRGRENEPAVAVDPRNTNVIIGSSNDYCAVYNDGVDGDGAPIPSGPIWLGYYRSETAGASFTSSLVPGYPGDTSPYAARAKLRTASSGDPVLAWDAHGRLFAGSESSDDPAGSLKTFGDVWVATYVNPGGANGATHNDGKEFKRSVVVAKGTSAPFLLGKFNDKTALEADRTLGRCDGNVYFSYSRFTGNGGVGIYFSRSTDHGVSFSHAMKLSASIHDVQFPDIAVTGNGDVYVTFREFSGRGQGTNAIDYVKSTDCGATFGPVHRLRTFTPYDASDVAEPEAAPVTKTDDPADTEAADAGNARDCGDFGSHCLSGYTFFRRDTQVRSTADQTDAQHAYVYIVYDPSKPGTQVPTGTTYGSIDTGVGSQSGTYFIRLNGANGQATAPALIDPQATGHQLFPDISADAGSLHALWWDSRNDPCYSRARPVGNCANLTTVPSLDVYATSSTDGGATWATSTRLTDMSSNPNYEQFGGRTVPFAGDYLWISSVGSFSYGVWTDWRNTVAGIDQREAAADDNDAADVLQCRTFDATAQAWTGDTCPRDGGLDQNIYGDYTP